MRLSMSQTKFKLIKPDLTKPQSPREEYKYRLYSTSVQTVQYKFTDCKVQVAEVGQKISGPKNIQIIKNILQVGKQPKGSRGNFWYLQC